MWIQFFLLKLCHFLQGAVSTFGKQEYTKMRYIQILFYKELKEGDLCS